MRRLKCKAMVPSFFLYTCFRWWDILPVSVSVFKTDEFDFMANLRLRHWPWCADSCVTLKLRLFPVVRSGHVSGFVFNLDAYCVGLDSWHVEIKWIREDFPVRRHAVNQDPRFWNHLFGQGDGERFLAVSHVDCVSWNNPATRGNLQQKKN